MSAHQVTVSAGARRDVERYTLWLRAEADAETAVRFAEAVDATFQSLAANPKIASPLLSRNVRLRKIRKWPVAGFPKAMIFFEVEPNDVIIIRLLHSASDWWAAFQVD